MTDETYNQGPYAQIFTEEESQPLLTLDLSSAHVLIDGVPIDQYIDQLVQALLSERNAADHEVSMAVAALLRRYQQGDTSTPPEQQDGGPSHPINRVYRSADMEDLANQLRPYLMPNADGYTIDRQSVLPAFAVPGVTQPQDAIGWRTRYTEELTIGSFFPLEKASSDRSSDNAQQPLAAPSDFD